MLEPLSPRERQLLDEWKPLAPPDGFAERVLGARATLRHWRWIAASTAVATVVAAAATIAVTCSAHDPTHLDEPHALATSEKTVPTLTSVAPLPQPLPAAPGPSREPDLVAGIGESFTVHDPRDTPSVVVAFRSDRCSDHLWIEVDRGEALNTPHGFTDKVDLPAGAWAYAVACGTGGGPVLGDGHIIIVHDAGDRVLSHEPPPNRIDMDGRSYRITYQTMVPAVRVRFQAPPGTLHASYNGSARALPELRSGDFSFDAGTLADGRYALWSERNGKRERETTLIVAFDDRAPQVQIDEPRDDAAWDGSKIEVRGLVRPEWKLTVVGLNHSDVAIPLTANPFHVKVPRPTGPTLALRFEHPQRGVHYYLRHAATRSH